MSKKNKKKLSMLLPDGTGLHKLFWTPANIAKL